MKSSRELEREMVGYGDAKAVPESLKKEWSEAKRKEAKEQKTYIEKQEERRKQRQQELDQEAVKESEAFYERKKAAQRKQERRKHQGKVSVRDWVWSRWGGNYPRRAATFVGMQAVAKFADAQILYARKKALMEVAGRLGYQAVKRHGLSDFKRRKVPKARLGRHTLYFLPTHPSKGA